MSDDNKVRPSSEKDAGDDALRIEFHEFIFTSPANCLPSGCSCGCHSPIYGINYSHVVPCCDQPDTAVTPPEMTHLENGDNP